MVKKYKDRKSCDCVCTCIKYKSRTKMELHGCIQHLIEFSQCSEGTRDTKSSRDISFIWTWTVLNSFSHQIPPQMPSTLTEGSCHNLEARNKKGSRKVLRTYDVSNWCPVSMTCLNSPIRDDLNVIVLRRRGGSN